MPKKKSSGNKKKSSGSDNREDYANQLFDWLSEGYVVAPLTQVIKSKDKKKIEEMFSDYSDRINRLDKVNDKLQELDFNKETRMYEEVSEKLNDPMQVAFLEKFARTLEEGPRLSELKAELASLNTNGFQEEANRIKTMFDDNEDLDDIEKGINKLKKKIKEKFFENAFEEVAVSAEDEVEKKKDEFVAETIFLLHRDGTLLSVKSKKPPSQLDKKLMSRMVMAVKEQMSRAFREGEHVHTLKYEGHTIILEDSVHVYAAVVIVGEAKPVMYRIILKALQIMEKKLGEELEQWTGDRSKLDNLDRYTSAIFQALDKLN